MGKEKRFNSRARNQKGKQKKQEVKTRTEKSAETQPIIFSEEQGDNTVDEYQTVAEVNKAILLPKDDRTDYKVAAVRKLKTMKLSKNQKRKLKQVIERKNKTAKRSELLKSLSQCQVSEKELAMYKSISKLGQKETMDFKADNVISLKPCLQPEIKALGIVRGRKKGKKTKMKRKNEPAITALNIGEEDIEELSSSDDESQGEQDSSEEEVKNEPGVCNEEVDKDRDDVKKTELQPVKNVHTKGSELQAGTSPPSKNESKIFSVNSNMKEETGTVTENMKNTGDAKQTSASKPAIYVEVKRTEEIQAARVLLPILAEEQMIMETIQENSVIIISGETGSGKTTQVPQFLYEAGFSTHSPNSGMIGITEPRRVAAVSMSKRVATEMNLQQSVVSYQIRYEGNATDETRIKFMTDGVLLKEMETDFLLSKYSVIIIDEAHERSVFTDILIGLLSRVVPLRNKHGNPMKLIIMSATLKVDDFISNKGLFPSPPPLLKVDSRQYPVTVHFNRRTPQCYVTEAYNKICKIHRTLKSGGILVFVTGQNEVHALCRKLRKTFPATEKASRDTHTNLADGKPRAKKRKLAGNGKGINLDDYPAFPEKDSYTEFENDDFDDAPETFLGDDEEDMDDTAYDSTSDNELPLYVLPLYSLLSTEKQAKVFEPCPEGTRLCVIATNVAETSLTIPGIKYVVDSGKVKSRFYDKLTGVSAFRITWTSKASANQRAGRAGRVEPGHCYRLYSSAVFQHDFQDFSEAEICRRPADELMLLMKSMSIDKVESFPFPTCPDGKALKAAEDLLVDLGALERKKTKRGACNTTITLLGRSMSQIPVAPRYAKMILLANQGNCMQYMLTIVAALTVKEIFTDDISIVDDSGNDEDATKKRMMITQARRKWAGTGETLLLGDMMVILRAVGACEYAGCTEKFCKENGLRYKAMVEIRKLRAQLSRAVNSLRSDIDVYFDPKINPPTDEQAKVIRQILLTCLGDRVARKIPQADVKDLHWKNSYQSCSTEDPVFIHPASALFKVLPEYVVYQEIIETSKLYMRGLTCVEENWLPTFAPYKCTFSKPVDSITPSYNEQTGRIQCHMTSTFGPHSWPLPAQELDYPACIDRTKWFARSFLEGKVCKCLKEYVPYLLTPASVMVKTWAKLQPRTEALLKELLAESVYDRNSLLNAWKSKTEFLLVAYLQWIPESLHGELRGKWPPV